MFSAQKKHNFNMKMYLEEYPLSTGQKKAAFLGLTYMIIITRTQIHQNIRWQCRKIQMLNQHIKRRPLLRSNTMPSLMSCPHMSHVAKDYL